MGNNFYGKRVSSAKKSYQVGFYLFEIFVLAGGSLLSFAGNVVVIGSAFSAAILFVRAPYNGFAAHDAISFYVYNIPLHLP